MNEKELQRLADELWRRMEPLARAELERLFTNYMSTRTLLEPELVQKLFDAMRGNLHKFLLRAAMPERTTQRRRE